MLECGFCGSNLSRRRWHSNSKYKTTIWQCIRATKDGKRFCPDSKGIPEETIEKAFIESYRMLSTDNQDILEEFLGRIEKTLNRSTVKEQARKIQNKIDYIQARRKKLLDNFLQGIVVQDIYEETDLGYQRQLANLEESYKVLEQELRKEKSLSARIKEFKKELLNNQILEEFDRAVFDSLIEKVIIGGYDEDGNKDPYKITFIYKT